MVKYPFSQIKKTSDESTVPITAYLQRPLIKTIVWINVNFIGLSPNQVTFFSLILAIITGYLFITGQFVLGSFIFMFSRIMDFVDGQTARLTGKQSKYGGFFDNFVGGWNYMIYSVTFFYGEYLVLNDNFWIIAGNAILFFGIFNSLVRVTGTSMLDELPKNIILKKSKDLSLVEKVMKWMLKRRLIEPISSEELMYLSFFISPIISIFWSFLAKITITITIALFVVLNILLFFQYKKLILKKKKLNE